MTEQWEWKIDKNWENSFDKIFQCIHEEYPTIHEQLKSFIRKLLEEESGYLLGKKIAEEEAKAQCADELEKELLNTDRRPIPHYILEDLIKKWRGEK